MADSQLTKTVTLAGIGITLVTFMVGIGVWIGTIQAKQSAQEIANSGVQTTLKEHSDILNAIKMSVQSLEKDLGSLTKELDKPR